MEGGAVPDASAAGANRQSGKMGALLNNGQSAFGFRLGVALARASISCP
jgi:hypothetical protein